MCTAGRTIGYSAATVGLCLMPMALFPMYALRSLAYGSVAVVVFAALASLFVGKWPSWPPPNESRKPMYPTIYQQTGGIGGHG